MIGHPSHGDDSFQQDILKELTRGTPAPHVTGSRLVRLTYWSLTSLRLRIGGFKPLKLSGAAKPDLLTDNEWNLYKAYEESRLAPGMLNRHYAAQYKGSYILNYTLAVAAVSFAVFSLGLLAMFTDEAAREAVEPIVFVLGALKLLCLLIIYINTEQAKHVEFNQRAIAYRFFVEQLRCMYYLPMFGIRHMPWSGPYPFLGPGFRQVAKSVSAATAAQSPWPAEVNYHHRLRSLLLFVQTDWVKAQQKYHANKSGEQEKLNLVLERRVKRLNLFVIWVVALDVLFGTLSLAHCWPKPVEEAFHHWITPVVLSIAAIIPAAVAAYNGLRSQTEARRLSMRSAVMSVELGKVDEQYTGLLHRIEAAIGSETNPGSFTAEAMDLVKETARTMMEEAGDWTFIFTRDVPEP